LDKTFFFFVAHGTQQLDYKANQRRILEIHITREFFWDKCLDLLHKIQRTIINDGKYKKDAQIFGSMGPERTLRGKTQYIRSIR
jgi:hypothetical protein